VILLEEKLEVQTKVSPWLNVIANIAFNAAALYLSHLITLQIWRSLTGH
jgi:hypothetical protein